MLNFSIADPDSTETQGICNKLWNWSSVFIGHTQVQVFSLRHIIIPLTVYEKKTHKKQYMIKTLFYYLIRYLLQNQEGEYYQHFVHGGR